MEGFPSVLSAFKAERSPIWLGSDPDNLLNANERVSRFERRPSSLGMLESKKFELKSKLVNLVRIPMVGGMLPTMSRPDMSKFSKEEKLSGVFRG